MAIETGREAPDFTLKDQHGNEVSLHDFRGGQNVVIVFYPFTFSGICEAELCTIRDDPSAFETAGAQVLAISCDSRFAQAKWAGEQGYDFPVLSDFWPHGATAQAYDVFDHALGCATRTTFVIDKAGVVAETFASPNLGTSRDKAAYDSALARLK